MFAWLAVEPEPKSQPDKSGSAGDDEGPAPAEARVQKGHNRRNRHRAEVRARVEDAGGKRALFFRKPFGDGFYARGKIGRLAQAKKEQRNAEGEGRDRGPWEHGGKAPEQNGVGEGAAGTKPIGYAARAEQADRVRRLKGGGHVAVLGGVPTDDAFESLFEKAENAAIQVRDYGGEEEQPANGPAEARGFGAGCRKCHPREL